MYPTWHHVDSREFCDSQTFPASLRFLKRRMKAQRGTVEQHQTKHGSRVIHIHKTPFSIREG